MRHYFLSIMAAVLLLTGIGNTPAVAGGAEYPVPNQWNGSSSPGQPFATGLGDRVITALAVSPDGRTVYAGTGSGTAFFFPITAPAVTTNAITNIVAAGATLNATVNARNAATTVTFEYGTDTSYGSSIAATPGTVTGLADTAVSADLTGLTQGTTYHYRVVAVSSGGTSYGSDRTIDITPPETTITASPETPTKSTSASFTFNGNDGSGSGVSSFECSLDSAPFASCSSPQEYTGLGDGNHTFSVQAIDAFVNRDATPASFTWLVDTVQPDITLSALPNGAVTRSEVINLAGIVTDSLSGLDEFAIGGVTLDIGNDGRFSYPVELANGSNSLTLTATDESDNVRTVTLNITRQAGSPLLTVTSPDNVSTNQAAGQIQGTVDPAVTGVTIKVNNNEPLTASINSVAHTFTIDLDGSGIISGLNTLLITATDGTNSDTVKRTVFLNTVATLAITSPAEDLIFSQKSTLPLTISLANATMPLDVNISKDGGVTFTKLTSTPVTSGDFTASVPLPALQHYPIVVTATDPDNEDNVLARVIRTAITKYRPCGIGTASTDGEAPCTACAAGSYQDQAEQTSCKPAPAGSYVAEPGSWTAILCPIGYYQDQEGQTSCKPAPAGRFVASPGQSSAQLCAMGTYQPDTGQFACLNAPVGTYVAGTGAVNATDCAIGSYQDLEGQTSCKAAPAGSFVDSTGQSSAQLCALGTYQPATGQASCLNAPAGSFVGSTGQTASQFCAVGTYQPLARQSACLNAPAGTYVAGTGAVNATDCAIGSYQDLEGQTSCKAAPAGSFVGSTGQSSAQFCALGTYQPATGQASCLNAPAGSFVGSTGQTASQLCAVGTYQPLARQSACLNAPAGTYVAGTGAVNATDCAIGSYQDLEGQTSCKAAPAGSFVGSTGQSSAQLCALGTYQPATGQASCLNAPAGSFVGSTGQTASQLCAVGTYQPVAGQSACLNAPTGKYVAGTGAVNATDCAIGSYQDLEGQSSCKTAPAGSFVGSTGQSSAQLCALGTYQPATGQASCLNAPAGSFVGSTGQTTSQLCAAGTYQPAIGQASCLNAPAGSFVADIGAMAATPCDVGFYQDLMGQSSCKAAPAGNFVATTGQTAYAACAPGSYQDQTGQSSCKTTPAGSFSGSGQPSPTPCTPGTYQPASGQSACLTAPAGGFVASSGQTTFEFCAIGSYQPLTGQTSCTACPVGFTTNITGQTACIPFVTLTVVRAGFGSGSVTDASSGISCGSSCATTFGAGLRKTLTVTPDSNNVIAGVTGCNGSLAGTTYTTGIINASCTVTATFRDTTVPALVLSTLSNSAVTTAGVLNITGITSDSVGIQRLTVNDQQVLVQADGSFNTAVELAAGLNTLRTVSTDNAGNQTTITRNITYNNTALAVTVAAPADGSRLPDNFTEVSGTIGAGVTSVNIHVINPATGSTTNSAAAAISGTTFTATVNLASGMNTIEIVASGPVGTSSKLSRTLFADTAAPYLAIDTPAADVLTTTYYLNLAGVVDRSTSPLNLRISTDNGISFTPLATSTDGTSRGTFAKTINLTVDQLNPIIVQALDSGNNLVTSAQRNVIYRAPLSLTFDPVQPKAVGTPILVTAKVYENQADYSFRFLLKAPLSSSATEVQPYSVVATWNWDTSSLSPGEYTVTVQAKRTGSAAAYDLTRSYTYIISPADGATDVIFKTAPPWGTTFLIGDDITVTAEASGGSGPYEYQFKVLFNDVFIHTGSFSTSPDFTWATTGLSPGAYRIYVYARKLGSSVAFEAYKYNAYGLMNAVPMSGVVFTTAPVANSSIEAGASIPLAAQGSGGSGNYEYQFKIYKDTTLVHITSYQTANTFTWLTTGMTPGEYRIYVYARQAGSTIAYEVYKGIVCYIVGTDRFRIAGPPLLYFSSLQSAYTAAASDGVIQALNLPITGPAIALTTTRRVTVTVDGGWNGSYSSRNGFTTINGKMQLRAGKLVVRNLKVR